MYIYIIFIILTQFHLIIIITEKSFAAIKFVYRLPIRRSKLKAPATQGRQALILVGFAL